MATRRPRRRSWGTLRTMRNGRIQASYSNGRRYYSPHTYDTRMDAEGWLANERRLIERGSGRHRRAASQQRPSCWSPYVNMRGSG
jgi:hypothetical protein